MRAAAFLVLGLVPTLGWADLHDRRQARAAAVERLQSSQLSAPRFKAQLSRRYGPMALHRTAERTGAVLRFTAPLDQARLRALEQAGVAFERIDGEVAHIGGFYGVRARPEVLSDLLDASDLLRVMPSRPQMIQPSPLDSGFDKVHRLTTAKAVWPTRDQAGQPLTGAGVTICDIDGAADIFHPMFFRPDAGLYSWIDVDGDERLTPGVDAVDLDGDGKAGEGELLRALGGNVVDLYYGEVINPVVGFHPARQWLYADANENFTREFGPTHGFNEGEPAYGEPLFLADDVDRDGHVGVGEKLLRLGTSKFKGVFRVASGEVFMRGANLIEMTRNPDAGHGTGVGGILAGGEYGRSFVHGVAPDAELLLIDQGMLESEYSSYDEEAYDASLIAALDWGIRHGADVFVHEYGSAVGEFADGSSGWEAVLDELSAEGAVQATATHNFADNHGHAEVTVPAGGTLEVPFETFDYNAWGYTFYMLQGSLRWRDSAVTLSATLVTPGGVEIPLSGEYWEGLDYAWSSTSLSPRGTGMVDLAYVQVADSGHGYPAPLPEGSWTLRIDNPGAVDVDVYVTLTDDTSYSMGVAILLETTQLGTIAHPATADSVVSVGASVGYHVDVGEEEEGIKRYSGRGPRIDGELGVDVVAPEDHYTAAPDLDGAGGTDYMSFGGTSGALPQVAGAVALLLQAEPELTPAEVKARLHQSGGEDGRTGAVPNPEWGYGRLAVHELLTGEAPVENEPPLAQLTLPEKVHAGEPLRLDASGSSDAEDSALRYRFDVGYDGVFDLDGVQARPEVTIDQPGLTWIKVEVQDSQGYAAAALASIEVGEARPPAETVGGGCGCAAEPSREGGGLLLLGLLGLVARRRRG